MAQIMKFMLNLLLIPRKFLPESPARTLYLALKQFVQFQQKILTDYENATQMITHFENTMEFMNYTATKYISEGDNCIVTGDLRCLHSEMLSYVRPQVVLSKKEPEHTTPKTSETNPEENQILNVVVDWLCRNHFKNDSQLQLNDHEKIVETLYAIVRSQEFVFKNVSKLIKLLENDQILVNHPKLEVIETKLFMCADILASKGYSRLIDTALEEEMTGCWNSWGGRRRSGKIEQKTKRPLATKATNTSNISNDIDTKVQTDAIKRARSEPDLRQQNVETTWEKIRLDIEQTEKLIQVNEDHFNKFESILHTST